jgi:succinate dehydrogenase / fumarate reductase membrane anchor subunit
MGNGTPLGQVRGLGSAKEGAHHWWHQRLTAGGNLLLVLWFVLSIARLPAYDHATLTTWIGSFWVAIPLALLVLSVFWHFRLGLQVCIEDYSHGPGRIAWIVLLNAFTLVAGAIALFSILSIAFSAGAAA